MMRVLAAMGAVLLACGPMDAGEMDAGLRPITTADAGTVDAGTEPQVFVTLRYLTREMTGTCPMWLTTTPECVQQRRMGRSKFDDIRLDYPAPMCVISQTAEDSWEIDCTANCPARRLECIGTNGAPFPYDTVVCEAPAGTMSNQCGWMY